MYEARIPLYRGNVMRVSWNMIIRNANMMNECRAGCERCPGKAADRSKYLLGYNGSYTIFASHQ